MSVKPCDRCTMIMVNNADMWFIHSHVAALLDGARLELRELKARSTLLGAYTICPLLRSDLEAAAVEIEDLKHRLDHSSRCVILSPPCKACVSLKGKLLHATKENIELQQEVAYLSARWGKHPPTGKSDMREKQSCGSKERNPQAESGSFYLHVLWSCWSLR
jgi:hypothetical protein